MRTLVATEKEEDEWKETESEQTEHICDVEKGSTIPVPAGCDFVGPFARHLASTFRTLSSSWVAVFRVRSVISSPPSQTRPRLSWTFIRIRSSHIIIQQPEL